MYTVQDDYSFAGGVPNPPYAIHESIKDKIDPEYQEFFTQHMTENSSLLYTHRTPLKTIRSGGNVMPGQSPLNEVARIYDIKIPRKHTELHSAETPARVFVPLGEKPIGGWPLFVWFHGGGWVLGNITTENSYCTKVASLSSCVVISVDYRLAPEHPYPAAVNDAFEAVMYAFESGPTELDIDNKKIAIGGSSAGGNLTAIVTHMYASSEAAKKLPPVVFQLLVVPVTDNTASPSNNESWKECEFTPQLPAEKMLWYRALYLPNEDDCKKPESLPLFYSDESFAKVPPCLVAAAGCDILRSEAQAYHEKLVKNGVPSNIIIYPGVPHPVMAMDAVLSKGRKLIRDTTDAIRKSFYNSD